jgi:hypothetical protein
MPIVNYHDTGLKTYSVDLDSPPEERWKPIAKKEARNIGKLLQDVVNLGVQCADRLPAMIQPLAVLAGKGSVRLVGRLVDFVAGMFGEDYVLEIRSIAKYADQPLSHVILGNLMYDAFQAAGIVGMGCSSYSCNIDGMPTLVRNMDWVLPRSTGRHSRLIHFHRGRQGYVSVSVLGCVGVVSATSAGRWAVTINQAPTEGTSPNAFQWPVLQRLRHVCDQLGGYQDLVDGLQEYRTMTSFFAHVVGVTPNQHTVITGLGSEFRRRGLRNGSLVQTNHFANRELAKHNGPTQWTDEYGQDWVCDSHLRLNTLRKRLRDYPASIEEARRVIRGRPVTTTDTMQQMIFQPSSGISQVWLRP